MRYRYLYSIVFCILFPGFLQAQQELRLRVKVDGVTESTALIGRLRGSSILPVDTVTVNEGIVETVLRDPVRGVYRLQYNDSLFIEFLSAGDSSISLHTSARDVFGRMQVQGSPENVLFFEYWQYRMSSDDSLARVVSLGNQLLEASGGAPSPALDKLRNVYLSLIEGQKSHISTVIREHQGWLAASLIMAYQIPDFKAYTDTARTPLSEMEFYRTHFFDNINFNDPGLINSEVYYIAINDYLSNFTKPPSTQSYMLACSVILETARGHDAFYDYSLNLLIRNFEYTVWESVFSGLVEQYYLDYEGREATMAEYYGRKAAAIRNLQTGKTAPDLVLPDTTGHFLSLSQVPGNLRILFFWSAECESCEEIIPDIKKLYDKYGTQGLSILAVSMDYEKDAWLEGIRRNDIGNWYHVSDLEGLSGPAALSYNVWMTPVIYLLEPDQTIITRPYNLAVLQKIVEDRFSTE